MFLIICKPCIYFGLSCHISSSTSRTSSYSSSMSSKYSLYVSLSVSLSFNLSCLLIYIYLTSSYSSSMSSIYSCLAVWSSNEEHTTTLLMAVYIQEVIDKSENLELRIVIKSHNTWMHQAHVWQVDCILHVCILPGLYLTWIVSYPDCILTWMHQAHVWQVGCISVQF